MASKNKNLDRLRRELFDDAGRVRPGPPARTLAARTLRLAAKTAHALAVLAGDAGAAERIEALKKLELVALGLLQLSEGLAAGLTRARPGRRPRA